MEITACEDDNMLPHADDESTAGTDLIAYTVAKKSLVLLQGCLLYSFPSFVGRVYSLIDWRSRELVIFFLYFLSANKKPNNVNLDLPVRLTTSLMLASCLPFS